MMNGMIKCVYCNKIIEIKIVENNDSSLMKDIVLNEYVVNVVCNSCMEFMNVPVEGVA